MEDSLNTYPAVPDPENGKAERKHNFRNSVPLCERETEAGLDGFSEWMTSTCGHVVVYIKIPHVIAIKKHRLL